MHAFDDLLLLEPALGSERTVTRAETGYALKVMMVFQDPATQEWAMEMCSRAKHLVGNECISVVSWKISDLVHPAILSAAVRSAARATVVVVAVSAAEELPRDLHVWFDAWLPRRLNITSALVALIGRPEGSSLQASRTLDYLRAVARKGGLDFFPTQRTLPVSTKVPERDPLSFVIYGHETDVEIQGADFLTGSTPAVGQYQPHQQLANTIGRSRGGTGILGMRLAHRCGDRTQSGIETTEYKET